MKKIFKYTFGALLGVVALAFSACTNDFEYDPASSVGLGEQVFFSKDLPSQYNLEFDETTFSIPVNRQVTDEAITVNLTHTDKTGFYTIPSTVTFAEGQSEATIEVTYDAANMEYNNYMPNTIFIAAQEYTTPYGASFYAFTAGAPLTWKSLGMGKYIDNWFEHEAEVEILQCEQDENKFRVIMPYEEYDGDDYFDMSGEMDDYLELTIKQPGEILNGVEITRNDLVYFPIYSTGAIHPTYDDIVNLIHPASFSGEHEEDEYSYNRILEKDENGLPALIQLAPYYYMLQNGGWNYTQEDGMIQIYFPGNDPKDYSLDIVYTGKTVNLDGENFASFTLTMGEDVEEVKYVLVPGVEAEDVVADIVEGNIETESVTVSGDYQVKVSYSGRYAIVAVAFANGKAVDSNYALFRYEVNATETWRTLGIGTYTESALCELYQAPAATFSVKIEESQDRPGVYRLVNPYGEAFPYNEEGDWDDSKDYYIEINAQDPNAVFIEQQVTGLNWGDGEFVIQSTASYYMDYGYDPDDLKAWGFYGTLANGVISFPAGGIIATLKGEGAYQVDISGNTKIVLPTAAASIRAKARAASGNSSKVGHRKLSVDSNKKFKKHNQKLPSQKLLLQR